MFKLVTLFYALIAYSHQDKALSTGGAYVSYSCAAVFDSWNPTYCLGKYCKFTKPISRWGHPIILNQNWPRVYFQCLDCEAPVLL